jgi:VanZ family protein
LLKPSFKLLARNWWPVVVWLGIIRLESTDYASSRNTFGLLYGILKLIFGRVDSQLIELGNMVLRKGGHFFGYAVLSALTFLALKHTNRDRLKPVLQRSWGMFFRDQWRFEWAVIAVLLPLVAASLDEINQTFIPSRSGRWQDVAVDTCGAITMQIMIYALSVHAISRRRRESVEEPELSLTN